MIPKHLFTILLGLAIFSIGCKKSAEENAEKPLSAHSPSEIADMAVKASDEFSFCLSEEAGAESLKDRANQIKLIAEALPDSVSTAGLPGSKAEKINALTDNLKTACEGLASTIDQGATNSQIAKSHKKLLSHIKSLKGIL